MAKSNKAPKHARLKHLHGFAHEALQSEEFIVMTGGTTFVRAVGDIARRVSPTKLVQRDVLVSKAFPHPLKGLPPGDYVFLFDVSSGTGPFTLKVWEGDKRFRDVQPFPEDAGESCRYFFTVH